MASGHRWGARKHQRHLTEIELKGACVRITHQSYNASSMRNTQPQVILIGITPPSQNLSLAVGVLNLRRTETVHITRVSAEILVSLLHAVASSHDVFHRLARRLGTWSIFIRKKCIIKQPFTQHSGQDLPPALVAACSVPPKRYRPRV